MDGVFRTAAVSIDEALALLVGPAVFLYLTLCAEVERGSSDVQVALLDDLREVTEEQRHDQRVDVRSIDISIGHDNHFLVAQLVDVGFLTVFTIESEADTQCLDDVVHLVAFEGFVPHGFLYVQNLTAQGQDGLEGTVTALLGRAACRVTLDEEQFAFFGILAGAVGQLAGHASTSHGRLALYGFAGFAGSYTGGGGQYHFVDNQFGFFRMFLQIVGQGFTHGLVHGAAHFAVAQLRLGLAFKLRFGHLDGDDGDEALTEVFSRNLYLGLLQLFGAGVFAVFLQYAGQGRAESGFVRTAFLRVDVVHVGVEILAIARVIHDGALDGYACLFGIQVDDVVEERRIVAVQVADEFLYAFYRVEGLLYEFTVFFLLPAVGQCDADAGVQVGQLAQAGLQGAVFIFGGRKDTSVRPESLLRTCKARVASTYFLDSIERFAAFIFLLVDFPVAEYLRRHVGRQGVDARHTYAVQTARHLIGTFVELTSGMEHGHYNFQRRFLFLGVEVYGDTAAVILYGNGIVFVDGYFDVVAVAGHGFVDGVVHHFVYQVVQTVFADVADVHGGAFSHRFQSFQHLDVAGRIVVFTVYFFFFCHKMVLIVITEQK